MYSVFFTRRDDHVEVLSRYFNTIRAARRWARWLMRLKDVAKARIDYGHGGIEP